MYKHSVLGEWIKKAVSFPLTRINLWNWSEQFEFGIVEGKSIIGEIWVRPRGALEVEWDQLQVDGLIFLIFSLWLLLAWVRLWSRLIILLLLRVFWADALQNFGNGPEPLFHFLMVASALVGSTCGNILRHSLEYFVCSSEIPILELFDVIQEIVEVLSLFWWVPMSSFPSVYPFLLEVVFSGFVAFNFRGLVFMGSFLDKHIPECLVASRWS